MAKRQYGSASRRRYVWCGQCNKLVLTAGAPQKGDVTCAHRFSRIPITPTVYYENAAGQTWSGPDADTPCPLAGYQRKEVQAHEVRAFERLMTRKMQDKHRAQLESQRENSEAHARAREQARREMDADVLRESEDWDSDARELLAYAMEHRDDHAYSRTFDPEFHIGAYE